MQPFLCTYGISCWEEGGGKEGGRWKEGGREVEGGRVEGGREGGREEKKKGRRWHEPWQRLQNVEHGLRQ